jgi:cell division protein FtsQ
MTKEMPRIWKHIINITFGVLLVCTLTGAYFLGAASRKPIRCKGLAITVTDSAMNRFITPREIRQYLDQELEGGYIGVQMDSIDLTRIEEILDSKSAILKSQAFTTKDSILNVVVTQKKPVVRFQKGTKGFYAVEDCSLFPLQETYTSHVMVVDGYVPLKIEHGYRGRPDTEEECRWLERIVAMVKYIESSRTWQGKIVQITVLQDGDLMLIPREGKERFVFGQPYELEEKFEKMGLYYKSIRNEKGEDAYRTVDLRFEGQIVCRKD